jgi:HEAT repeat protein
VSPATGGLPTGPAARRRAIVIAGHRADVAAARAGLLDEEPAVRASALAALQRAGHLRPDELAAAMRDGSPVVRRRAAEIAAHHLDASLVPLLDDTDPSVVETAAWASGEHERADPEVLDRLISLAREHPDPLVREAAVAALGAIGDEGGLPAILAATADKPAVRRRAVLALAPFEGDEVDEALARALDDRDWQVRQAAEDLRDAAR